MWIVACLAVFALVALAVFIFRAPKMPLIRRDYAPSSEEKSIVDKADNETKEIRNAPLDDKLARLRALRDRGRMRD